MNSTIIIEIELPVTYTAEKGYQATHTDPGCPDEIDDIEFSLSEVHDIINSYLEDNKDEIDGILLYEANESARNYQEEKAEHEYDEMIAKKKGLY